MNHHMLGAPPQEGGMEVQQMYWAYRCKYVTSMQLAMRAHPELFPYLLERPSPACKHLCSPMSPSCNQRGQCWASLCNPCVDAQEGPTFDGEDPEDGLLLAAQQPTVG